MFRAVLRNLGALNLGKVCPSIRLAPASFGGAPQVTVSKRSALVKGTMWWRY